MTGGLGGEPGERVALTGRRRRDGGPTRRAVAGYILFRLVLGIALLMLAALAVRDRPGHLGQMSAEFGLAGVLFLAMGTSAALLNRFGRRDGFIWSQLLIDTVFATALVSVTEGPISPFFPLYFVNIVAAAWLLPPRGALAVAFFDAAAYGLVLGLVGLDQSQRLFGEEPLLMYSQITLQVFAVCRAGADAGNHVVAHGEVAV